MNSANFGYQISFGDPHAYGLGSSDSETENSVEQKENMSSPNGNLDNMLTRQKSIQSNAMNSNTNLFNDNLSNQNGNNGSISLINMKSSRKQLFSLPVNHQSASLITTENSSINRLPSFPPSLRLQRSCSLDFDSSESEDSGDYYDDEEVESDDGEYMMYEDEGDSLYHSHSFSSPQPPCSNGHHNQYQSNTNNGFHQLQLIRQRSSSIALNRAEREENAREAAESNAREYYVCDNPICQDSIDISQLPVPILTRQEAFNRKEYVSVPCRCCGEMEQLPIYF
eukprot:TRINITY_DN2607_c0_g5_i1.p1 TRINITY_DN2607_c0_g5~~TRINITY_DN2607_c0_g5_i1.p1  ORF type:complete len:282 (-),score=48.09 TRINITY_DN2607_c0_g5_i1:607-1452(-)